MGLIIDKTVKVIDTTKIDVGDLIYINKPDWTKGRCGLVVAVSHAMIKVCEVLPDTGGATSRFTISAADLSSEKVELRWSKDLKAVNSVKGGGMI